MKTKFTMPDGEVVEKDMPVWKTPWNHDTNFESDRTALFCADESLAKQEFKEETDINFLLERFMKGGEPPPIVLPEHFMDISARASYFEMQSQVAEMSARFYMLPAGIRAEFLNDPNRWADAVVKAVQTNDRETLDAFGIELKPPQNDDQGTPRAEGTPAPNASLKASEAVKPGSDPGNKAGEPPAKSETQTK